jgi:hypothetical protein
MFEQMTPAERIRAAKEKTERVLDHLLYLLALHENNAWSRWCKPVMRFQGNCTPCPD